MNRFRPLLMILVMTSGVWPLADAQVPPSGDAACGTAQTRGCHLWETAVDGPGHQWAATVATSRDGTKVFTAGGQTGGPDGTESVIFAFDAATGAEVWRVAYQETLNYTSAIDLAVSPDDQRVYVLINSNEAPHGIQHIVVLAIDVASGARLWTTMIRGGVAATSFVLAPQGHTLYIASGSFRGSWNLLTFALDTAVGDRILWSAVYDSHAPTMSDRGYSWEDTEAIAVSPDGRRVFIAGTSANATLPTRDTLTIAYDAVSGTELWQAREPGYRGHALDPTAYNSTAHELAVSPDGAKLFVLGTEGLKAYDTATGKRLWRPEMFDNACHLYGWTECDIAVHPAGTAVFTRTRGGLSAYDAADGKMRWQLTTGTTDGFARTSIAIHPDGETLYVHARGPKTSGLAGDQPDRRGTSVEAYRASDGLFLWRAVQEEGFFGHPSDLTVGPDGRVYALSDFDSTGPALGMLLVAYPDKMGLIHGVVPSLSNP